MSFLNNFWEGTKSFFHYSETILWARLQVLVGFMIAVMGAVDWSPLLNYNILDTGFSWNQMAWTGIAILANGIVTELVRRRNMTKTAYVAD